MSTNRNDPHLQVLGATSGSLSLHHLHNTIVILYQVSGGYQVGRLGV